MSAVAHQLLCDAECLWFRNVPQFGRYFVSSTIGNAVLFAMDRTLYSTVRRELDAAAAASDGVDGGSESNIVSFFVSYMFQIAAQHLLNAYLVFGRHTISTRVLYQRTLIGTYATYAGILVSSTVFHRALVKVGIAKVTAFWTTFYLFGVSSFLTLRKVVAMFGGRGEENNDNGSTTVSGTTIENNTSKVKVRGGGGIMMAKTRTVSHHLKARDTAKAASWDGKRSAIRWEKGIMLFTPSLFFSVGAMIRFCIQELIVFTYKMEARNSTQRVKRDDEKVKDVILNIRGGGAIFAASTSIREGPSAILNHGYGCGILSDSKLPHLVQCTPGMSISIPTSLQYKITT